MTAGTMAGRSAPQTVFVFQGGGALGAYQAGVAEALLTGGIAPDWLVGTSIGAINAALIAGNAPAQRLAALREFWARVSRPALAPPPAMPLASLWQAWQTWQTLVTGIPGFFRPRGPQAWDLSRDLPLDELGFYDTSPLADTLRELVDFDRIAAGDTRLTLCAVDLRTGRMHRFDNRAGTGRIGPEHVMASGALPPGFAPVQIGDGAFWDGGVYSNTPLDVVLDDNERRDSLCFTVDLWDASEAEPHTMAQALMRLKDIQYASRIGEQLDHHQKLQNLRRAVRLLGRRLNARAAADPGVEALLSLGCDARIDVVHLLMQAQPGADFWRDIDFTDQRTQARWAAGVGDADQMLARAPWRDAPHEDEGLRVHVLERA